MGLPFVKAMTAITQASWDTAYYARRFRTARTVAIRKPDKGNYTTPDTWRPIALLNTVGKVIEAVTVTHLRRMAEQYGMLPEHQMGGRQN